MEAQLQELRVSNDAANDSEELRRRISDEGYLFFRKLQSPDKLANLRREMLTVIQQGGWLVAGTDPMDGIADISRQCTEGDVEYTDVYHEVYKLESFHRSAHEPEVATIKGHRDVVTSQAFSPDGKLLASGSDDTTIQLWTVNSVKSENQRSHIASE